MASRPRHEACWFMRCPTMGDAGRVTYTERGGQIDLTLCAEHAREVRAALADQRLRWGVMVTSHDPPHVIVEEPRRRSTGRYRHTAIIPEEGGWPEVILRRSLHSRETNLYVPVNPRLFPAEREEGIKYEMLWVSPEEYEDAEALQWPKSLLIERVLGGYTDRQAYLPYGQVWDIPPFPW